jgi:hypothetical protein
LIPIKLECRLPLLWLTDIIISSLSATTIPNTFSDSNISMKSALLLYAQRMTDCTLIVFSGFLFFLYSLCIFIFVRKDQKTSVQYYILNLMYLSIINIILIWLPNMYFFFQRNIVFLLDSFFNYVYQFEYISTGSITGVNYKICVFF